MTIEPDGQQQLLLYLLAVSPGGCVMQNDVKPDTPVKPARRKPLEREGLIEIEKQKRKNQIRLTEKGWAWCNAHLGDEINVKSNLGTVILARLLQLLERYFDGQQETASLGQFVLQATRTKAEPGGNGLNTDQAPDLDDSIRRTCLELGNGRTSVRVRLADLRARLNGVDRGELDRKLLSMERDGALTLYRLDNPEEIRPEDRDGVLHTATGQERHIVYYGGPRS